MRFGLAWHLGWMLRKGGTTCMINETVPCETHIHRQVCEAPNVKISDICEPNGMVLLTSETP